MSVLAGLLAQDQDGDDQEVTTHAAAASTQGDANFTGGLDGVDDEASLWVQRKAQNPLVDLIRFADGLLNLTEQADSTMSVLAGLLAQDQDGDDQEVTTHAAAASTQGDANFTGGLDGVDDEASLWVQRKAQNPLVDLIRFADGLLNLTAAAIGAASVEYDVHPNGGQGRRRSTIRRRRRSVVWKYMTLDPSGNEASCTYCTKKLSANSKGGTSHLRRHVNKCALRRLQALLMDI
uniref:BED-type domain-containing protein n=1 Tax=Oryza barthii TaxID=65489 RepID=A0A0D3HW30_9ORYZ